MTDTTAILSAYPHLQGFLDAYTHDRQSVPLDPTRSLDAVADRMTIHTAPFIYGTVDDFLPSGLYQAVLDNWPDPDTLATVTLPGHNGAYIGSRRTHMIEGSGGALSSTLNLSPWSTARTMLGDPGTLTALARKFPAVMESNLSGFPIANPGDTQFRLWINQDEGAGEALGAHVDALHKILTIVVYIDLRGEVDASSGHQWGTAVYDAPPQGVSPMSFSSNSDHTPAAHVEFAANRAFVMPNTADALHGVAGGQNGVTRRTLMCGYWLADN